jgi:hypothetical protein
VFIVPALVVSALLPGLCAWWFRADTQGAILAWQGNVLAAARVNVEGDETKVSLYTVGE